jgi:iron complex outermembrane receptor protein
MSRFIVRAALLGCSALVLVARDAQAQQTIQLPQINVTAPSPIRRAAAPPPRDATPAAVTAPSQETLQGTLPIVTDQFATVTVVPTEEIRRNPGSTLGDLLFAKPGITGSSFAPGASSRPIVRGLDVNRVGIVDNGVGGGGVSDLGEDHFVPVNPLATARIEVIRGPATLRYGSQSIGGVVSSTNNRIPDALPCGPFNPLRPPAGIYKAPPAVAAQGCTSIEGRGAWSSVDNGREGGVLLDSGAGNFAFHADGFGRSTDSYRAPRYPYLVPPDPADLPFATQPENFNGRQPNSQTRSDEGSVGGSYLFAGGFAGMAYTHHDNLYGIPGPDGEGHHTRIDARQDRLYGKGEFRPMAGAVDAVRFWWGYTDYKHTEIGFAAADDPSSDGIRQTFTNKEVEGRVETQLAPFNLRFAELTTAIGVQAGQQRLTAPGDDPTVQLNGLFDPNKNWRIASYIFNEFKFSETTKAQIAGRIEHVSLDGTTPAFFTDVFDLATPGTVGPNVARERRFTPASLSAGVIQNLPGDLVGSVTAQYVERAPRPAELFSRGPHDATATFDIGNPNLKTEVAKSIEVGLRRAKGPFRFEATAYYTRFDGFIFRSLSGALCNETSCGVGAGDEELNQARYSQRDAIFRGGEFQFQWDTLPMAHGFWGVDGQYDIVRATFTDGTNVPRIPPQRVGGGMYFRNAEWLGRVSLLHAVAQNDIAPVAETPTGSYTLLRVELSHTEEFRNHPTGIKRLTVGLVGNNLLNDDIRNHVSYTKDFVLMPGAGVRLFASAKY